MDNGTRQWVGQSRDQWAILSGAMAIMHPDMYATGREALVQLGNWADREGRADMQEALAIWPSVFSVASLMVNRATAMHLDGHGQPQWLDLLANFGEHEDLDLVLSTIGVRAQYNPGTVAAVSGNVLHHGVAPVSGNRASMAFYMRHEVHEHVGIGRCNFMDVTKVPHYS